MGCASSQASQLNNDHGDEEADSAGSVIQFGCDIYYAMEGEDSTLAIDVVRLGDCSGAASVEYHTEDSSAKAGHKYVHTEGQLVFEPGETKKFLDLDIMDDDCWNATLECSVVLSNVEGAAMGKYLYVARVKIIDDDCFPTNRYKDIFENVDTSAQHAIPGISLMFEFIRLCLRDKDIFRKTATTICLDQLKGVYFFLTMYLQLYLVDTVLLYEDEVPKETSEYGYRRMIGKLRGATRLFANATTATALGRSLEEEEEGGEEASGMVLKTLLIPGSRQLTCIVVAILYCAPCLIIHLTDLWMCHASLQGSIRRMLQANLLRKFLDYKEELRPTIRLGELQMIMTRDVREVVDLGYMKILMLLRIFGLLNFSVFFMLLESPPAVLIPLIICPFVLILFLYFREHRTKECVLNFATAQDEVVERVSEAVRNYRLVSDFMMHSEVIYNYENEIDRFHAQESGTCAMMLNNSKFASSIMTLFISLYIIYAATQCKAGHSLGSFVTTINCLKEMGVEVYEISIELVEIQKTFEPLGKIAKFMNLPTDVTDRRRIGIERRRMGAWEREQSRSRRSLTVANNANSANAARFPIDTVPIKVEGLSFTFAYPRASPPEILNSVTFGWEQGKLYCLVGPPHGGKSTLLKLIGQVYLPPEHSGTIFVPPHLRILHLHRELFTVRGGFLRNVVLSHSLSRVGGLERVKRICNLLNFDKHLLKTLDEAKTSDIDDPDADESWKLYLTDSSGMRLTLARALVMNPEVILLHKPTSSVSQAETTLFVELLLRHVEEKGLELPQEEQRLRRPRTVFFTSNEDRWQPGVHRCFSVSTEDGIVELSPPEEDAIPETPRSMLLSLVSPRGESKSPRSPISPRTPRTPSKTTTKNRSPRSSR